MVQFIDLPSEIVFRIIDLTEASFLDNEAFPLSTGRKATLLRFSLVSRAWRVPSQRALHRRIFLREDAYPFMNCPITGRYPTRYLQLTQLSPTSFNCVLDHLVVPNLDYVALHELRVIEAYDIHIWSLCHPALRDLKSLQIEGGKGKTFIGSLSSELLSLPRLHSLGFEASISHERPGVMETIISACKDSLIHLGLKCTLDTAGDDEQSPAYISPTSALWTALIQVAPRLTSLSFQGLEDPLSPPRKNLLAQCSSLIRLELEGLASMGPVLHALPPDARLQKLAVGQYHPKYHKVLDASQTPKAVLCLKRTLSNCPSCANSICSSTRG